MTLDLPDADLAGQLCSCGRVALQRKGTVQRLLAAAPHAGEGDFLRGECVRGHGEAGVRERERSCDNCKIGLKSLYFSLQLCFS